MFHPPAVRTRNPLPPRMWCSSLKLCKQKSGFNRMGSEGTFNEKNTVCLRKKKKRKKNIYSSAKRKSKIRLMRSLVTSIFLYARKSWTPTAELKRRIQAMEMRCYRKILHISYKDHVTNEEVRAKIQQAIEQHEDVLTIVKRRKLQWYSHVSRSSGLAKTTLQGTV